MKTLFNIRSDKEMSDEHNLLFEIGNDYCTYAYWHQPSNTIDHLQFISFTATEAEERVRQVLGEIVQHRFRSVIVCSAYPQALLVPTKYYHDNHQLLDLVYEQPAQAYFHDRITDWQMINVYSMPQAVYRHIQNAFPAVELVHAYTPGIKVYNGYVADNQLMVHFTPCCFRVLLKKEMVIYLAQTYTYSSPLDVVYYLLKICYEFGLDQSSVFIILSGLVEKDSNLYTELEQYFLNIHFAHPPEIRLPDNHHPQHFFTSLYNLATCAL